jgi:hypothetical protein
MEGSFVASQAIERVVQMLRDNSPMRSETIQEMRVDTEASSGLMPLPAAVQQEERRHYTSPHV